ncbi:uncharacterized protein LOC109711224 [Ananas comosus]|uniref:ATP-dependent DNA helicase n=1 Tax=Ananas comosus TaxID=4615 RepID=A0A6P5F1J9_ANACO|nr:uncharacterized protein LOC109711224 [Ananas comosus]XP_020089749.1 uncharacterized protein LOC109711224 [Ananas comosus]XP_020089750.1 uncharacterized protein LOC109711224 [Ananas comosus]XP_020089751.1 uncharacterized protein LOC109711224 [Ananas comosus]
MKLDCFGMGNRRRTCFATKLLNGVAASLYQLSSSNCKEIEILKPSLGCCNKCQTSLCTEIQQCVHWSSWLHNVRVIRRADLRSAPMNHRNCFEALDRSLRDILCTGETTPPDKLFGAKYCEMEYISLKNLTLTQQHVKIKIRVSRIWESTTPQLKKDILSLDCLLIDEEGYAMQATIRKHDATTFRALFSEDVIGNIVATGTISFTYVGQERTAIRKLQIGNLEDETLSVTLWDKFAIDFNDNQHQEKVDGPAIVVFASMSVRTYRDQLYISTCSA